MIDINNHELQNAALRIRAKLTTICRPNFKFSILNPFLFYSQILGLTQVCSPVTKLKNQQTNAKTSPKIKAKTIVSVCS